MTKIVIQQNSFGDIKVRIKNIMILFGFTMNVGLIEVSDFEVDEFGRLYLTCFKYMNRDYTISNVFENGVQNYWCAIKIKGMFIKLDEVTEIK